MMGTNRSGDQQGAKAFEFLRITAGPDGVLLYWAAPQGGAATPFRRVGSASGLVTFENRANPYPMRITYRLLGDTLEATIEGRTAIVRCHGPGAASRGPIDLGMVPEGNQALPTDFCYNQLAAH